MSSFEACLWECKHACDMFVRQVSSRQQRAILETLYQRSVDFLVALITFPTSGPHLEPLQEVNFV